MFRLFCDLEMYLIELEFVLMIRDFVIKAR